MAQEAGLDLVEIAPNSSPPVAKILDFGKYKYQAQKKAAEARKKQKVVEIKEIKLRPMIDDHDYDVKMRSIQRFFEEGDKVKVTLRFRGREMAHQELGYKLLDRVKVDTSKIAKIEQEPRFEGRQVVMVLAPRERRGRSWCCRFRRRVRRRRQTLRSALPSAITAPFRRPADQGLPWRRLSAYQHAIFRSPAFRLPVTCLRVAGEGGARIIRRAKCPRSRPSRALKSASR
jgi:translation initiation factor IF-3